MVERSGPGQADEDQDLEHRQWNQAMRGETPAQAADRQFGLAWALWHTWKRRDAADLVMLAWLIPRLTIAMAIAIAPALAEHIARLPLTLTDTRGRLAILKAVLVQIAQRDLHPFRPIRGDNRLFGNELAQILANGLFHPLIVLQAILRAPGGAAPMVIRCSSRGMHCAVPYYFSRASRLLTYLRSSLAHSEQ